LAANAAVTGAPDLDGWVLAGNSLDNGVYVRGTANYGYDCYSAVITDLAVTDPDAVYSWLSGDTILGVGGKFADTTAAEAGWGAFSGPGVNSLLYGDGDAIKIQAKFGTENSDFFASTLAPSASNGGGSLDTNGKAGAIQIRSTAYFQSQNWAAGSGVLQYLDKPDHIVRSGASAPDPRVARLIWTWDSTNSRLDSWEILLNVSLLERVDSNYAGLYPSAGSLSLLTVQNRDGAYTDGVVRLPSPNTAVPEPMAIVLGITGLGSVAGLRRLRKK